MARTTQNGNPQSQSYDEALPDDRVDPRTGLTRLSPALMGCNPAVVTFDKASREKLGVAPEGPVAICDYIGQLTGTTGPKELPKKAGEATAQITYGLVGLFEGTNLLTGEIFNGNILYLPQGFHEMFLAEIGAEQARTSGNAVSVEFAVRLSAIPASNPRGYSWTMRSLLPPKAHDPLRALRGHAQRGLTQLTHGPMRVGGGIQTIDGSATETAG